MSRDGGGWQQEQLFLGLAKEASDDELAKGGLGAC